MRKIDSMNLRHTAVMTVVAASARVRFAPQVVVFALREGSRLE
jgi:hypothetical protein